MRLSLSERWYILKRSFLTFWLGSGLDNGAKLTFFSVLAFAPLVLAIYSVASLVLVTNKDIVDRVSADFIASYVPDQFEATAQDIVTMVVGTRTEGLISLILSVAISLFSSSAYVRAFSRTANDAYGVLEGRNPVVLWAQMFLVTAVLVIGVVLVLAALMLNQTLVNSIFQPLGLSSLADFLDSTFLPIWRWIRWPFVAIMLTILLDVLYYFAPNVKTPKFKILSAGSTTAALGIALVGFIFTIYLQYLTSLNPYGALSTGLFLLFMLWGCNTFVVFGMVLDAETERMKLLRQGVASEENINLPLRSVGGVEFQERVHDSLVDHAKDIRKEAK